jgi:hypothetical protein
MKKTRSHNYKIRMQSKSGGLFTITRNAKNPEQAMRYANTQHEQSTGAVAVRAWKHQDEPDPRDWVNAGENTREDESENAPREWNRPKPAVNDRSVVVTIRGQVPNSITDLVEVLAYLRENGEVTSHIDDNERR